MIRRIALAAALLLLAAAAAVPVTAGLPTDLDAGRRLAAETGRPLVLDFSSRW